MDYSVVLDTWQTNCYLDSIQYCLRKPILPHTLLATAQFQYASSTEVWLTCCSKPHLLWYGHGRLVLLSRHREGEGWDPDMSPPIPFMILLPSPRRGGGGDYFRTRASPSDLSLFGYSVFFLQMVLENMQFEFILKNIQTLPFCSGFRFVIKY